MAIVTVFKTSDVMVMFTIFTTNCMDSNKNGGCLPVIQPSMISRLAICEPLIIMSPVKMFIVIFPDTPQVPPVIAHGIGKHSNLWLIFQL